MTPRIITADVARELLHGATEGPWEVGVASSWQGSVRVETEMYVRRPGDNVALAAQVIDPRTEEISESNARLLATAPDLAHTVVAQAAEIERLRAIVNGRTASPTGEEIEAHHRAGGTWYVASTHGRALTTTRDDAIALCGHLAANGYSATWWAIDTRRRPCAWPVVAEASR